MSVTQLVEQKRYFWTTREEKILRDIYPARGIAAAAAALPNRSEEAIYNHAALLGIKVREAGVRSYERYKVDPHIDALIARTYQSAMRRNAVADLARTVGRPRWWISKRAAKLGFVAPRFKEPNWSLAEDEIVLAAAHLGADRIQKRLKAKDFARTETAIVVRLKRIGGDRVDPDHYTANHLSKLMGIDAKVVKRWIDSLGLKSVRRGTGRVAAQGGDHLWIHRRDLRGWIISNAGAVDLRKVDKFWFIDLMAAA